MTNRTIPCPFCEQQAEVGRIGTPRLSTIIECTNCGCRLESPNQYPHHAKAWNTRPIEDALRAEVAALKAKLNEVQKGKHPFCSYCFETVDAKTADDLKAHIMVCPEHPLPVALRLVTELDSKLARYEADLTGPQQVAIVESINLPVVSTNTVRIFDAAIRKVRGES
jgi:hypothetical protein